MTSKGFLRAHVCLTATTTALLAGTAWGQASASQNHTIKHGETVELLSRSYHVPLKDILAANHLAATDILRDGRTLIIPDAPKPVIVPASMAKAARIKGDRISIRIGPASTQHRLRVCDNGSKVLVTAEQDGWLQVSLADGRSGWVRSDFVCFADGRVPDNLAHNTPKPQGDDSAPDMPAALPGGRDRSGSVKAQAGRSDKIARKHHEERHPLEGASAAAKRRNEQAAAHARHERRVQEAAAAKRQARLAHEAAHRHNQEVAAAKRHQKHLAEIAEARRHSAHMHSSSSQHAARLAELAEARHRKHLQAVEAHRRQHEENVAHARKLKHLHELAAAKHRHHLETVVHTRSHHQNEALANYLHRQQLKLAKLKHHHADHHAVAHNESHHGSDHTGVVHKRSHHDNEALANYLHRQQLKLARLKRHHADHKAVAHNDSHHESDHSGVAHKLSHHQNEALANYLHRMQVKAEHRKHREQQASVSHHESGHYSHHIRPEAESPSASNDVVRSAFAYRGTPYRWGMSRPGGFDCSGFTKYIYARKGVSLPRTAAEQYHAGKAVGHKSMKPGDLVFFHTTRSGISHVGMYVGNGKFVHSSSQKSGGVRVDNLDFGYYNKAFRGARRVRPESSAEPSGE